ncbi:MAG: AzlC family ABC transporter permease [Clostridia bacterium]|nr:AzlC family ABC transporter permease [Clostridia bacterium]
MEQNSFKKGIVDGLPICVGYFAVSFAFGIFAVGQGLTWLEAVLISVTNLTSAGQLAGVPIIAGGGTFAELAVSQLVINSRYSLMSVSLSQKLSGKVKLWQRFIIAFGNTDEIFAVATANPGLVGSRYMYGLIITPVLGWSGGTLLGAVAGDILPAIVVTSLGVAIYGMFIAIVVPQIKRERSAAVCAGIAVALSCAFYFVPALSKVPSGFTIIICAIAAALIAALLFPLPRKEGAADDK